MQAHSLLKFREQSFDFSEPAANAGKLAFHAGHGRFAARILARV
jgi:hypothetical protein